MDDRQRKPKRTKEEMIAELDRLIEFHVQSIEKLKMRKEEILSPKVTYWDVVAEAKKKGLTAAKIAELLDIEVKTK